MKTPRPIFIVLLVLVWSFSNLLAQTNLRPPVVSKGATGVIKWTAGTVNNGGHAVAITAGTASLGATKNDCSSPGFAACDFLIASSGGSVSVATTSAAVVASGVTLLAIIETDANSNATRIVSPQQVFTGKVFGQ